MKFPQVSLSCLLFSSLAAPGMEAAKPNILLIVADDLGYADVGFHGCRDIPTPNLDALAASGVRFTNAYASAPVCSPSRAGLLTGRYQTRFGHEFNPPPKSPEGTPAAVPLIAERLKAEGYATACIGKWHIGGRPETHPLARGFDEFFGFLHGAHGYLSPGEIWRGRTGVAEMDYTTDAFGREAVSFIDRHKAQPWFVYLSFNAVHTPMEAPPGGLEKFSHIEDETRRAYNAMTASMDEAIGAVLRKIRQDGLEKNTLVVFLSDNGGPTLPGTTVNASSNAPFRGGKRALLEGGIRVPMVFSWPGRIAPGVYEQPVIHLDAGVTALAVAGVKIQEDSLDGVDLLPFLKSDSGAPPHEALYWRMGEQMAIREGNYKLVRYDASADSGAGGNGPITATPPRLYDLSKDPAERNDLAAIMPEKALELQARWDVWNSAQAVPLWGGKKTNP